MIWSSQVEVVLSKGLPLHNFGINNWALSREQALIALGKFEKLSIPILGGDVYEYHDNEPESNNDNWYVDQKVGEPIEDFVKRSISYARNYINSYKSGAGDLTPLFVFVPDA